ncbi:MAG: hypothetical protein A2X86_10675 [Bdellovibrionales bacterium GWA2_49_15]|nr:MAG: hypothetical protein A2X86_10675 [Bdellovibrionales bacterium GWA2_49_15]HAZ11439.1 hypothetical protein [Bdellovibrionales bacterium]
MIFGPLKYFLSDYLKKLLLATVASICFGLFLLGPLADSVKERMLFLNWAISVTLYGTFFYAYPLQNISKWYMNTPIPKSTWFSFNCIFQICKLLLTSSIFIAIIVVEKILYPVIPVSEVHNEYLLHSSSLIHYAEEFLSSSMVGLMLTFLTLFLCFVFNVDPYGPFRAGIIPITKERFKEEVRKWWNALERKDVMKVLAFLAVLWGAGILICNWAYSKALLVAIINTIALGLVAFTYDRAFTFTRPFQKKVAIVLAVYFLAIWQGMLIYSRWLSSTPLSIGMKLQEFEFQGKRFKPSEYENAKALLQNPELNDRDIERLVFLAEKSFPLTVVHPLDDQLRFDSLISHPFLDLDLEKICQKKTTTSGFLQCLNLMLTTQLTPAAIDHLLDALWALEDHDDLSNIKFLKRLWDHKIAYSEDHIRNFLQSSNPYKQFIALTYIEKHSKTSLLYSSGHWFKEIKEVNFSLAREVVSKASCFPIHNIDLLQGTFLRTRRPASCALTEKLKGMNAL